MDSTLKNLVKAYYRLKDDTGMESWAKDVRKILLEEFSEEDLDSGLALKSIEPALKPIHHNGLSINGYADVLAETESFLEYLDSENFHEDKISDYEHGIFESVMKAMYGEKIFDYINSKIR